MLKIKTVSSPSLVYKPSPVFQVYDLISTHSNTEDYIESIKLALYDFLARMFKEPVFQIMVITEELVDSFNVIKTIVKLTDKEKKYYRENEPKIGFNSAYVIDGGLSSFLDYYSDDVAITKEKTKAQFWCNTVQKFFENNTDFGFKGNIRLKAAFNGHELECAEFTATGKGTNDRIVRILKAISITKIYNKKPIFDDMAEDELYALLQRYCDENKS